MVITKFIRGAREVEVDAVAKLGRVRNVFIFFLLPITRLKQHGGKKTLFGSSLNFLLQITSELSEMKPQVGIDVTSPFNIFKTNSFVVCRGDCCCPEGSDWEDGRDELKHIMQGCVTVTEFFLSRCHQFPLLKHFKNKTSVRKT